MNINIFSFNYKIENTFTVRIFKERIEGAQGY